MENVNVFEQISQICRDFRKQISQGKSPLIEKYLSAVSEDGREILFSNLLEIEINYRRSKGKDPSSNEYLTRFAQYAKQIRRAFFEPTLASIDLGNVDNESTHSLLDPNAPKDIESTFDFVDANRLGDYELVRELGRGGMGVVYEARHTKANNRVALKTLPTGGQGQEVNADKLYRFRREFRRLSEINHPNLVGMQTLEVDGSQWFFTMDLVDGDDFLSYARPANELNEQRLRSCLVQLAQGVMALHREGIVHRDLKPSNVLVSEDGRVSILDFGLAAEMQKTADMTHTKSGMFAGTPPYAAPEQLFGERTEASDWYAFGTMLYEALVGTLPFTGNDPIQLLRDKQNREAPRLFERPGLPDDLAQLADGLIKREPGERITPALLARSLHLDLDPTGGITTAGSHGSSETASDNEIELEDFEDEDTVLIGREDQLAQLESIKSEFLANRNPQTVWVSGLSGEGKSSLVEKFLRPIRKSSNMLVLSGRCYDRESVPFKVIDSQIDSLVRFLNSRPLEEVENQLPDDIDMLVHLFPLLNRLTSIKHRSTRDLSAIDDKQIRYRAFSALKKLLFNIGQSLPVLMFVDDLQWGDADSAEIVINLLSPPEPLSIFFLANFRSDEAEQSPFLKEWFGQVKRNDRDTCHHEIRVDPLSEHDCYEFLLSRYGDGSEVLKKAAKELYQNTRGNPYFLEQLIEGFDPLTGDFDPIPIEQIIENRLAQCPRDADKLLEVIAVAGKSVSIKEAAAVAGIKSEAFNIITHMRSEKLIRLIGTDLDQLADTYHDKIRENVYATMKGERKDEIHGDFIERLEQTNQLDLNTDINSLIEDIVKNETKYLSTISDLAYHARRWTDQQRRKIYTLLAARLSVTQFANDLAFDYYKQAINEVGEPPNLVDFQILFGYAYLLHRTGQYSDALDFYERSKNYADSESQLNKIKHHTAEITYFTASLLESLVQFEKILSQYGFKSVRRNNSFSQLFQSRSIPDPVEPFDDAKDLATNPEDMLKFHVLVSYARPMYFVDAYRSLDILREANKFLRQYKWSSIHGVIHACYLCASGTILGDRNSTKTYYKYTLKIAKYLNDLNTESLANLYYSWTVRTWGEFDSARVTSAKAMHGFQKLGDTYRHLWSAIEHAISISFLGQHENAINLAANSFYRSIKLGQIRLAQTALEAWSICSDGQLPFIQLEKMFAPTTDDPTTRIQFLAAKFHFLHNHRCHYDKHQVAAEIAQILKFNPRLSSLVSGFEWMLALATYDIAITEFSSDTRKKRRQLKDAVAITKRVISKTKNFPMYHVPAFRIRSLCLAAQGKLAAALKTLDRCIKLAKQQNSDLELHKAQAVFQWITKLQSSKKSPELRTESKIFESHLPLRELRAQLANLSNESVEQPSQS